METTSKCKSCGADIVWIRMESGKQNPCDLAWVTMITVNGELVQGRLSHFATCPDANAWRDRHREARE